MGTGVPGSFESELFGPGPVLKPGHPDDSNFSSAAIEIRNFRYV